MSPTADITMGPVLPIELFGCIIDELVSLQVAEDNLQTLRACSMVSKAFVPLCRAHIFREVIVSTRLYTPPIIKFKMKMIRFFSILASDPSIGNYVRALTLHCDLAIAKDEQCEYFAALLQLPNIQALDIQSWGAGGCSKLREFRKQLIEINVSKANLQSLHVRNIHDLPFDKIFACSSLRKLSLNGCNLQALTHPRSQLVPSHIKHLEVEKCEAFPMSIFFQAKNLETLVVKSNRGFVPFVKNGAPGPCRSSFGLKTLILKGKGEITTLLDGFIAHAEGVGCKPFENVQNLAIALNDDTYCTTLSKIFPGLYSLRMLKLTIFYRGPNSLPLSFSDLQLHKYCRNTFNLTELFLRFEGWGQQDACLELVDHLRTFFESISPENSLQRLSLHISTDQMSEMSRPSSGAVWIPLCNWCGIDEILADRSKFPKLKHVEIWLHFKGLLSMTGRVDVLDPNSGSQCGAETCLERVMWRLADKGNGVAFETKIMLS